MLVRAGFSGGRRGSLRLRGEAPSRVGRNLHGSFARRAHVAKLPARQKVSVLIFRRSSPDTILVVQREVKRGVQWSLPSSESGGESSRLTALSLAAELVSGDAIEDLDLGMDASYKVNNGPRAGQWTERFHAVEVAPDCRAVEGQWMPHYEAKAQAGADAPRVREAVSRLRELARLKP